MTLDFVTEIIVTILLLPLQLILIPIDAFLAQIPGIGSIPSAINTMVGFVGTLPGTLVRLLGIMPFMWNMLIVSYVLYIGITPGVNGLKKIWAWVRP
jgi:hypothetical protein